ncbi:class I SAM-dependent methyltransferase [Capillimicrobium parvum]|uniref:Methyltransferase domain-containing protein n=1 Tax=Capillimicrobium parvum TaxID=2884022 RepID=A0A9E6Y2I3_9ACTN|nr:hypothetical protein [Capillimicrobium parvum]UGS38809.1 hypothetical protein DSM104329_05239 [Capillimicrobium parvum]
METGAILVPSADGSDDTVAMYALLDDDVAALLVPNGEATGWKLAEVPERLRPVISARHPERKLRYGSNPGGLLWRDRPALPLVDVAPAKINLRYTGGDTEALLRRRGQTYKGDWDREVEPFAPDAAAGGELTQSIATEGYKTQQELDTGTEDDEVLVAIGRDGRFVLVDGAKRVAAARAAGLESIPVNVVARHPSWETFRDRVVAFAGGHQGRVYQRVEHPDLFDLQAHHFDDRLPVLTKAFEGYDIPGKKLMDIGAHWGQMSRAMEDLGFDVTAVEANPQSARIATRLRDATEYRYEIWEGSVFEFPRLAEMNVVLGLNIFHHFLKTQEMYEGMTSMLDRLDADILIFAAHVYERRGPDMDNAYRNYPPDEFAQYVSEHSRLPQIDLLGHSHDGRPLFKLSRNG